MTCWTVQPAKSWKRKVVLATRWSFWRARSTAARPSSECCRDAWSRMPPGGLRGHPGSQDRPPPSVGSDIDAPTECGMVLWGWGPLGVFKHPPRTFFAPAGGTSGPGQKCGGSMPPENGSNLISNSSRVHLESFLVGG